MEEKSSLAPWEELTQAHEQVSKPTDEVHPAEHLAQAHEGIKEIKEEPVLGAVVGGKLGATFAGGRFALEHAVDLAKKRWGTTGAPAQSILKQPSVNISNPVVQGAGAKGWLGSLTGTNIPGGQMSKESLDTANRLASIVQPGGEFAGGELRNGIALPVDIRAKATKPTIPPSAMREYLNSVGKYANKVSPYVKNVVGGAGRLLGPVAAGAGAGYQGLEAAQRFQTGDPIGGVINLVGSAGSLASLYPPTMVLGTGTAMGAEALNAYRDKLRSGEIKHEAPSYENINPMGDTYAGGGLVHMAEGRQPSVSLEELDMTPAETSAAFGKFPQMNPKRAQPQGGALHGYLDALLGAPEYEDLSVLEPKGMAYKNAYRVAEPYGMAANMVAPIASVGKTVGKPLVKALGQHAVDKVFSGEPLIKGMDFLNPQVLGAVKFKGGNTPLGLGSTLPLEKQGDMGRFLNQSQITDPLKMFETNLKTHYDPNQFDRRNLTLGKEWENYLANHMSSADIPSGNKMTEKEFLLYNQELLKAKREAAENFALRHNNLSALGFEEGNKRLYPPSSIESIMPHYNNWVNGPLKSHITKTMGTGIETDPMLKLMNESAIEPKELFGNHYSMSDDAVGVAENANRRREKFTKEFSGGYKPVPELEEQVKNSSVGKQTATTPIGKYYEDLIDSRLYPRGTYSFNSTDFPGTKHIKNNEVISDFMGLPDDSLGFGAISKKVIDGLLSGEIPLNKLTSQTPANVLQSIIKEKTDAMKALQKDDNAYQSWRQVNNDALPAETRFTDVDGNPTNKKLVIFDSKMANENPDLLVRNLSQETRDLNHCGGSCGRDNNKYVPMVNPHTGVANKGAGDYGKNYVERIKDGRISIASLRGADGESKATLELSNDGKLRVSQLKGHSDGVVDPETANDLKNWLNHKSSTGELSERSISDLKNLRDVSDSNDVSNTIGKMVERNKEWNPATVENLLSANKSEMPRFFTDKEFEALAKKKGIDLTKDEAHNLENLSPRQLDYMDYFKPGSIRKSYNGYDQIIAYDPRTGKVKVKEVIRDQNGNWIPHPNLGSERTHSTHPNAENFQRAMGRPFRRDPEFE